ncbi:MAG: hypothetical protein NTW55_00370 [Planctomycetota bacterium]|nr:hypothetical protein [Planctomycetota bacterium]
MNARKNLNIKRKLAKVFLFIGVIGWFSPFLSLPFRPYAELPNSMPHGIDVDKEGNIYCGSKFYGRIQKYYSDGRFACGYDTEGGTERGSDFSFHITDNGQLSIMISNMVKDKKQSAYHEKIYDDKCKLMSAANYNNDKDRMYKIKDSVVYGAGNRFIFKGFLFPRVIKETSNGDKSIIISTPIWLWFFQGPLPAFVFCFVSMFILIFIQMRTESVKKKRCSNGQQSLSD